MLLRNRIITTAAVVAACAVPASSAMADQVPQPPDAQDAAAHRGPYEVDGAPQTLGRDYGSPDAADAAKHSGLYGLDRLPETGSRDLRSPDAKDAARPHRPAPVQVPTVQVRAPSGGFTDRPTSAMRSPLITTAPSNGALPEPSMMRALTMAVAAGAGEDDA